MQEEKCALLISVFSSIFCSLPVERCGIQRKNWKLYDGFRVEIFSWCYLCKQGNVKPGIVIQITLASRGLKKIWRTFFTTDSIITYMQILLPSLKTWWHVPFGAAARFFVTAPLGRASTEHGGLRTCSSAPSPLYHLVTPFIERNRMPTDQHHTGLPNKVS